MTASAHRLPRPVRWLIGAALALVTIAGTAVDSVGSAAEVHRLGNGLEVTLYTVPVLAARLDTDGDEPIIRLDDGRYLRVITDIDDPAIYNKGDGEFHPFDADAVLETLSGVSHPELSMALTVYLLPYPRRNVLVSSTSGTEVFLSPHVRDIHPTVGAYIVAHELGHVFHSRRLPDSNLQGWRTYRQIRRIDDASKFSEAASHAYQPHEIFAEDFRVLFGGEEAAFGGTIENTELPPPGEVPGLLEFMTALGDTPVRVASKIRATSYPNPFNPDTEIRVVVPEEYVAAGRRVAVKIFDVSGALVNEVFSAEAPAREFTVRWNGTSSSGAPVASANYYALVQAGESRTTVKLVLLK